MVQIPVRCVVCGEPTGVVVTLNDYNNLTRAEQTCLNCHGAIPVQTAACRNCGSNRLRATQMQAANAELRNTTDGALYVQIVEDFDFTEYTVQCNECGHVLQAGEEYGSVEY